MNSTSDISQPLFPAASPAVYQISGNWSTVYKALVAILCRSVFEPEEIPSAQEICFVRDAVCFLYFSSSVDFAASGKKYLINILYSNNYKKPDNLEVFEASEEIRCMPSFFVANLQCRKAFPSARDYFGNLKNNLSLMKQVYKIKRSEKRRKRVKRFIGVGYRDKGHLKIKSFDGTPGWQNLVSLKPQGLPRDRRLYEYNVVADLLDSGAIPNSEGLKFQEFLQLLELEELSFYCDVDCSE